jgi:nicotinate-nucleotide adenylyltransferase
LLLIVGVMKRKIILFGGTFDPVHHGHTTVAQSAVDQIGADKLIFIPAKCSPHKQSHPQASGHARMAMLVLATADNDRFSVSDCELKRPSPSYSLDTINFFRRICGDDAQLYWLIGADMVKGLPAWHKIARIVEQCSLCIMTRPGHPDGGFTSLERILDPEQIQQLRRNMVTVPSVDTSSSEIRELLAIGGDVSEMVHSEVLSYIREKQLYT